MEYTRVEKIFFFETAYKIECLVANKLEKHATPINGFGCSDCNCQSHLFYIGGEIEAKIEVLLMERLSFDVLSPKGIKKLEKKT